MNENVVVKKKNKGVIVLLIILIVIVLGLSIYIVYDKVIDKNNVSEKLENVVINKEKKMLLKEESKDVVYDLYNEVKNDQFGEENIRLPYLNIDSKYADIINKEMKVLYDGEKDKSSESIINAYDYKYFINDNILSLIIKTQAEVVSPDYYVYNIDVYSGNSISNLELLNRNNIDFKSFATNLSNIIDPLIRDLYPDYVPTILKWDTLAEYYHLTLSIENCNVNNSMFLDSDGNLNVIVKIYYSFNPHNMIFNYDIKSKFSDDFNLGIHQKSSN